MKSIVSLVILATLFIAYGITQAAKYEPSQYEKDQVVASVIWEDACKISEYPCQGLEAPQVRRGELIDGYGMYGLYVMGTTIWISTELDSTQYQLTIFHEMIHYLQRKSGGIDFSAAGPVGMCILEFEAMKFSNIYASALGHTDRMRSVKKFKELYGC